MNELRDHILQSIDFIRKYAPLADKYGGYTVCFSGGKDSQVLLDLFKRSCVNFHAVYNCTTNDDPKNVYFIRKFYPEVEIKLPELNFFQLIEKKKMLPTINKRFCCSYFKESKNKGFVSTGVRSEESIKRSKYKPIKFFYKDYFDEKKYKGQRVSFMPILDWLEWEIWEYIETESIPINPCYEKFSRVGCMLCPFAPAKQIANNFIEYPKLKQNFLKTIEKIMDNGYMKEFHTNPQKVLEWWMSKRNAKEFFTQTTLEL